MQNRKRSMMVFYILEVHIYVDMDHEKKGLRRRNTEVFALTKASFSNSLADSSTSDDGIRRRVSFVLHTFVLYTEGNTLIMLLAIQTQLSY